MYNFVLVNCDTDSISICKPDGSAFSEEEDTRLLKELNELFPEKIKWEDDGTYDTVIVLKAKNYILKEKGKPPKYKGSALKATLKEERLKDFIKDIIVELGTGRCNYLQVYYNYVREIHKITDISKWVTKKTVTEAILTNERANEAKVREAFKGKEIAPGDKIYTFFKSDGSVCLKEDFDGDYSVDALLQKLYATVEIFENVIPMDQFPNFKLKRNKKLLQEILNV